MPAYVYILRCADDSYYVGMTHRSPEEREWEHNEGVVPGYTHSRRPVRIVHAEYYENGADAFAREWQLKGWSRRKKEALLEARLADLPDLASRPKKD